MSRQLAGRGRARGSRSSSSSVGLPVNTTDTGELHSIYLPPIETRSIAHYKSSLIGIHAIFISSCQHNQGGNTKKVDDIWKHVNNARRNLSSKIEDATWEKCCPNNPHIASICVVVKVGYFDDPDDFPGLAHLLEHYLFIELENGIKKYDRNLYFANMSVTWEGTLTLGESTTFCFSINLYGSIKSFELVLQEVLKMLFHATFDEQVLAAETRILTSEFQQQTLNNGVRMADFIRFKMNHTKIGKFHWGNEGTLNKKQLKKEAEKMYNKYYKPSNVVVCIQAPFQVSQIHKTFVKTLHVSLENKIFMANMSIREDSQQNSSESTEYSPEQIRQSPFGKIYNLFSATNDHILKYVWILPLKYPTDIKNLITNSSIKNYLRAFMEGTHKNGLVDFLLRMCWISEVTDFQDLLEDDLYENSVAVMYDFSVRLTPLGFDNYLRVVAAIQKYVSFLHNEGPQGDIFSQLNEQHRLKMLTTYSADFDSDSTTEIRQLAYSLMKVKYAGCDRNMDQLFRSSGITTPFLQVSIANVLADMIQKEKSLALITSSRLFIRKDPYIFMDTRNHHKFLTNYSDNLIQPHTGKVGDFRPKLPSAEFFHVPNLPSYHSCSTRFEKARDFRKAKYIRIRFTSTDATPCFREGMPLAEYAIYFMSATLSKHCALTELRSTILNYQLQQGFSYNHLCQVDYQHVQQHAVTSYGRGQDTHIELKIKGPFHHLHQILEETLDKYKQGVSENEFLICKDKLLNQYCNDIMDSAKITDSLLNYTLIHGFNETYHHKIGALNACQYRDFIQFIENVKEDLNLDVEMSGFVEVSSENFIRRQLEKITEFSKLDFIGNSEDNHITRNVPLGNNVFCFQTADPRNKLHYVKHLYAWNSGDVSQKELKVEQDYFDLLEKALNCYQVPKKLTHEDQVVYKCQVENWSIGKVNGIVISASAPSSSVTVQQLTEKIDGCLGSFENDLQYELKFQECCKDWFSGKLKYDNKSFKSFVGRNFSPLTWRKLGFHVHGLSDSQLRYDFAPFDHTVVNQIKFDNIHLSVFVDGKKVEMRNGELLEQLKNNME